MRLPRLCLAIVMLEFPVVAAAQPMGWQNYAISETGANAEIPIGVFSRNAGKPDTGYGHRFLTEDGRANLTLQSFPTNDSPAAFLAKKNPPAGIIYKKVTPRFFAVSSILNGKIWYDRCNRAGGYMHCVLINYPAAEKRQWDRIVTRISNSLSSGRS